MSTSIALTARSLARHCFSMHADPIPIANVKEEHIIESLTFSKRERALGQNLTRAEISAAFKPLTVPPNTSFTSLTGSLLSEFDRSTSLIVEDLAPYVRSIIFYDLYLEKERLRLSSLLSEGGRDGKRIRTTRASRAALEGGSKAHTRRERWLPAGTNANSALRTGGQDWQHLAAQSGLEAH